MEFDQLRSRCRPHLWYQLYWVCLLYTSYQIGIIPVIAFNSVDEALPLCKALAEGCLLYTSRCV